ncbi:MAG: twin-arginine translocation signal domain-containing protein [Coriobacteriales bacterium]|nr:twin-arginine translocation signal domain-containing protein [Coriobacteriales bacterium]
MRWPSVSRRGFLRGTAAAAAVGAAVSVLPGCTNPEQEDVPEPMVVDTDRAINALEEYHERDLDFVEKESWTLSLGCVFREAPGAWVPATQAGSSAVPMAKGCAFSLESGTLAEVVPDVRSDKSSVVIYDVRCSDDVYAWVELDYLTHEWVLYASRFGNGALEGSATTLWTGSADYDPPGFVCWNNSVLWQITPALSGKNTKDHSFCYLWKLGSENAKSVVESPGRFALAPSVSGDQVILAPRVRADEGVFYGVTAYSLDDDLSTIVDQLVLPQTVKPFYATHIGDRFAISIEASYSSGGMFGTMGTYIGPSSGPFVRLAREPSANVAGKDDTFIIKSRTSYFVLDVHKETYSILTAANRSVDYGEFPVRVGLSKDFVTFATVKDEASGYPSAVVLRSFGL